MLIVILLVAVTHSMVDDKQIIDDFLKNQSMMSKLFAYPKILSTTDRGLLFDYGKKQSREKMGHILNSVDGMNGMLANGLRMDVISRVFKRYFDILKGQPDPVEISDKNLLKMLPE